MFRCFLHYVNHECEQIIFGLLNQANDTSIQPWIIICSKLFAKKPSAALPAPPTPRNGHRYPAADHQRAQPRGARGAAPPQGDQAEDTEDPAELLGLLAGLLRELHAHGGPAARARPGAPVPGALHIQAGASCVCLERIPSAFRLSRAQLADRTGEIERELAAIRRRGAAAELVRSKSLGLSRGRQRFVEREARRAK
ncbi:hypothetical protein SS50377_22846 [Spironucleus salmonicida]|uniref:Uncharacterized protein n=1 Tax=Spironucleus salmonicida TaxID=348837 RepID=A0A9P8LV88_9EUKA|nr:hypothetical protein SS50377_22846 [Spironucleus salmonicida]